METYLTADKMVNTYCRYDSIEEMDKEKNSISERDFKGRWRTYLNISTTQSRENHADAAAGLMYGNWEQMVRL